MLRNGSPKVLGLLYPQVYSVLLRLRKSRVVFNGNYQRTNILPHRRSSKHLTRLERGREDSGFQKSFRALLNQCLFGRVMCLDGGNDRAFSRPHYQSVVHAQSNPAVEGVRTVVERTFRFSRAVQCHPRCRSLHRHDRFHTRTHGLSRAGEHAQ